jgi:hypothetical protein
MRRERAWLGVAAVLAGILLARPAPAAPGRSIDYLYVESNEGGSSGGHVALRFGDRVFHYQYAGNGFLRVSRTSFDGFRRHYTLLENRTIHVARIPVSDETFDLLHDFFARRRVIQHGYFEILDSLADDRRVLEALRAAARGERGPTVVLEGAGFFFGEEESAPTAPSPALLTLRARIAATHGPDFLDRRREDARRRLLALDPRALAAPGLDLADDRAPQATYGFAQRYRDAMAAWRAMDVLQEARALRPGTYTAPAHAEVVLRAGEDRLVEDLAEWLAESLVRLAQSDRPDWGAALMVGLARLDALDRTRRAGAWVFLDVVPPDAPRLSPERLRSEPELLKILLREGQAGLEAARAQVLRSAAAAPGFREIEFAEMEASGNRAIEALRAAHEGRDLRLPTGRQPPARGARVAELVVPLAIQEDLDSRVAEAALRENQYAERLKGVYGYRLFTRNCVTEIFKEIDLALARGPGARAGAPGESRERLGGHVEVSGLRFIPAVSAAAVADTYAVAEQMAIPSHRQARLASLYRAEPGLRVFLRESNTLTSTVYRRNPEDSYFLFFTDDAVAARPLFGALNLATGLGATVAGVATLPFDRGKILWAGLKGVVFSLPELFFFNIRKGSFDYVRDDRGVE